MEKNDFISTLTNATLDLPLGKIGGIVNVNFGFSGEEIQLGGGLGASIKISIINTRVVESISLSDDERKKANSYSDPLLEKNWTVSNSKLDTDKNIWKGSVFVSGKDTGIEVYSQNTSDNESNNIWYSDEYIRKTNE